MLIKQNRGIFCRALKVAKNDTDQVKVTKASLNSALEEHY